VIVTRAREEGTEVNGVRVVDEGESKGVMGAEGAAVRSLGLGDVGRVVRTEA